MHTLATRIVLTLGLLVAALSLPSPARAGVAELSLDRAAVQDLLSAATPDRVEVDVPGLGPVAIELGTPRRTDFVDGGIQTTLDARIPLTQRRFEVALRYVPRFDPLYGNPLLVVRSATVTDLDLELASLLPDVTLPRDGEWSMAVDPATPDRELKLTYFVQGLEVEEDRLRLDLGLRVATTASRQARFDEDR